ncbi:GDSL-type esterase/lipase family protein [Flavihumibacter sp.]|uniref:GDSL-type esterase/lipase family protein n=1 Tax=Flavihumibacter sp. TaxID=1913981 RepID=UPI002FC9FBE5
MKHLLVLLTLLIFENSYSNINNVTLRLEWSMHSRFIPDTNFAKNEVTVNGYNRTGHKYLPSYVHPTGYGLTLKVHVNQNGNMLHPQSFRWEISGMKKEDGTPNTFSHVITTNKKILYAGSSMSVDTEPDVQTIPLFTYRGTYKIRIVALAKGSTPNQPKEIAILDQVIEVKDYLVIVMGDSFASGEGNPDEKGNYDYVFDDDDATWLEPKANRSYKGALSIIAAQLEADDPHTAVTFLNVATSGAKTSHGLLFQQHPSWQLKGQIEEVKDYIKDRKVHLVLLSIGLNDLGNTHGMSRLIEAAANPAPPEFNNHAAYYEAGDIVENISFRYDEVYDKMKKALNPETVVLFQMPVQFMRNESGNLTDGCGLLKLMENEDITRLESIGDKLIQQQKAACQKFQWVYVDGIRDLFKNHGYCAGSESWFVFINDSIESQGTIEGSIHPNEKGHRMIAQHAFPIIKSKVQRILVPTRPGRIIK